MDIILLLLAGLWSSSEGSELVGNYKFWNSAGDSIIYDHSGLRNHGRYSSNYFYFTDRGIMIYDRMTLSFPSSNIKEYPGYRDYMMSYWYLRKDSRLSRLFYVSYTNNNISVRFAIILGSINIQHTRANPFKSFTNYDYSTPNLIDNWRLYTFRVTQNLSNTESTIATYIDLQFFNSFTVIDGSIDSQSYFGTGGSNAPLFGIIYEIWWHKDVSNINELNYLLNSSSDCNCSYGCVTSPTNLCLPSYDSTYNYLGDTCIPECTESCNVYSECIHNSKSECRNGLYDIESGDCLFYCPDNSCILSNSLELTCKVGYKKVSDNPPACLPLQCISYERKYYRYECYECEAGYIPDYLGELCICDNEFTAVRLDPLICVKIDKCLGYEEKDGKYVCSSCLEGYSIDSEGNCNECESDYIKVLNEPFTCILRIENCNQYKMKDNKWRCEVCEAGYMNVSYEECIEDVEVCESNIFLSDGSCGDCPETCERCNVKEDKIDCTECKQKYTAIEIEDEIICILCSDDNPICDKELNTNNEADYDNSSNNSNSHENSDSSSGGNLNVSAIQARVEKIESSTIIITNISLVIASLCSALSLDATHMIRYMNDVKLLSYILYLNIYLPYEIQVEKETSVKNLEDINILSNIHISNRSLKDNIDYYIDDNYGFISRIPYQLATLAIILVVHLHLYILRRYFKGKLQALGARGIEYCTYTAYIQFYMVVYLDVSYYAISKISHVIAIQPKETDIRNIFDFNFALLSAVLFN